MTFSPSGGSDRPDPVAEIPRSGDRSGLTPTDGGNRKGSTIARIAGWLSVICGVAGVVISLAAIAGVWVVRSQVDTEIVAMTDTVDTMLGRAEAALAQVETRLDGVQGRVQQLGERGESLVRNGTVGREAANDLMQAVDRELGDVYRQFREAWVTLYTRVETTMDTLERLQQTVPPLRAVSLPRAELEAIDQRARQLDDALRGVRDRVSSAVEPVTSAVQALVDGLHRAEDGVSALAESVSSFESRLQGTRAAVLDARSTAQGWLTAGAVALTLVFVYLALAHAALVAFGWGYLQRLALARRSAGLAATDSHVSP